jgi:uncharacterized protein with PIN domain
MVIETSAIIAVLLNAVDIARAIESCSPRLLSAANFLEASIVIESRKGEAGGRELDLLIYRAAHRDCCGGPKPSRDHSARVAAIWQRSTSSRAELRRLLCLCSREESSVAAAVSGRRFLANRHHRRAAANNPRNRNELIETITLPPGTLGIAIPAARRSGGCGRGCGPDRGKSCRRLVRAPRRGAGCRH